MRVTPVSCCIGLLEEACLQDNAHGHVDGVLMGDREICERCVKQFQTDLVNQSFVAVA